MRMKGFNDTSSPETKKVCVKMERRHWPNTILLRGHSPYVVRKNLGTSTSNLYERDQ